jgi:hypothetical protein
VHSEKNPVEKFRNATLGFINTELETAETFADLALQSDDVEKISRTRAHARKGYDEARRFLAAISLTLEEEKTIASKMKTVESKLLELGETL